jgi:hypothetical protein
MTQYQLTAPRFQKANKQLLKALHSKLNIDKTTLSNNELLQLMSQAFFDKSFEELSTTLLVDTSETAVLIKKLLCDIPQVVLAYYGNETVLIVKGKYHVSRAIGTDMEIKLVDICNQADSMARTLGSKVDYVYLPEILPDEWEYDDIVKLAINMGYGVVKESIFDLLDNNDIQIFINGSRADSQLCGEWKSEMASEYNASDDATDAKEHLVWLPEVNANNNNPFNEFFFTFEDLCNAKYTKEGWLVPHEKSSVIVTFYREQN